MKVWWTIPGSRVSWVWEPDDGTLGEGHADAAGLRFEPRGRERARWGPGAPVDGQAFADHTATFALEANIRPVDMAITWVDGHRAVRWQRATGEWSRHGATLDDGTIALAPGRPLPGDRRDDLRQATVRARRLLTSSCGVLNV